MIVEDEDSSSHSLSAHMFDSDYEDKGRMSLLNVKKNLYNYSKKELRSLDGVLD